MKESVEYLAIRNEMALSDFFQPSLELLSVSLFFYSNTPAACGGVRRRRLTGPFY
jgi:hypothetical protein